LRVAFTDDAPDETCIDIIWELTKRKIVYEKAAHKGYMFNIEPEHDYEWVLHFLRSKEEEGLLWLYEPPTTQAKFKENGLRKSLNIRSDDN